MKTRAARSIVWASVVTTLACGKSERNPATLPDLEDVPPAVVGGSDGSNVAGQAGTPAAVSGAGGTAIMMPHDDGGMGGGAPTTTNPVAPTYPGYTLVLEEHFDAPIDLNADPVWTWSDGGRSYLNQARFVEEAISFSDGKMRLTTSRPAAPVPAGPSFAANDPELISMPFTSGELRTKFNNYRYGRYEASIKAPIPVPAAREQGNFITTFGVSRTPFQEEYREVIFDLHGGRTDGVLSFVIHGAGIDRGDNESHNEQLTLAPGFDTAGGFHTYALVWKADSLTWLIDDAIVATWAAPMPNSHGPPIPELSAKLILGTWIFNETWAFGGSEGPLNVYPFTTEVDFIRFYKEDGEIYPCDAPPSCLPAEDLNASKNNPKETDTEG